MGLDTSTRLNNVDLMIISLLNENGRISSAEIAHNLGDILTDTASNLFENLIKLMSGYLKVSTSTMKVLGYDE